MACMWGRFIVGTAHFSTESNLIWSNSIAIKSISPTLGCRKYNKWGFKSLDWKINTSLKKLFNLLFYFFFFSFFWQAPIDLVLLENARTPDSIMHLRSLLHQLNLILEFRIIKNFPPQKKEQTENMSWKTNGDLDQISDIDAKNEISLSKRSVYGEINFSAGKFLHWILISFKGKVC